MDDNVSALTEGAAALGIALDQQQVTIFQAYHALLIEWNERFNLIGPSAAANLWSRHFLDALTIVRALPPSCTELPVRCLDVGTGAGIPGIPLQIAFPLWNVVLLDATAKKVRFLNVALQELGLARASAVQGRAEEVAHTLEHRAAYDLCVARAVTHAAALIELTLPFVARNGYAVLYKTSAALTEELDQAQAARTILGAGPPDVVSIDLPDHESRCLVRYQKTRATPDELPRRAGVPEHHPLSEDDAAAIFDPDQEYEPRDRRSDPRSSWRI